jgi:multidrug efflux pump subunit AcrA (membrane-fusion protein)
MFAHVDLGVERHPNALVIPARAVVVLQEHSFVFIHKEGTAKKVAVTLGAGDGEWREACAGLTGEESIILPEGQQMVDGMPVSIGEGS